MDQDEGRDRVGQMGRDRVGRVDQDQADREVVGQDPAADRVVLRDFDDLDVARASRP
jgi:hypothetical protein